ncbi:MAG: hypothetical protein U1F23_05720 [Lysobacterales bacterium]
MLEVREDSPLLAEALQQAGCRVGDLLDGDALLELAVAAFGQPDFAHAADAERVQDAPRAEPARQLCRHATDRCGRVEESARSCVRLQQPFEFGAQGKVASADHRQPRRALVGRNLHGLVEQFSDAFVVHRCGSGLRIQLRVQSRLRAPPVALERAFADVPQFGDIAEWQSGKEAQFDQPCEAWFDMLQLEQCAVEPQQFFRPERAVGNAASFVESDQFEMRSTPLVGGARAGMVDDDLAHRLGGQCEEVMPPLQIAGVTLDQFQVSLVDQSGRVECRMRTGKLAMRKVLEFAVDPREQHVPRGGIAAVGRLDQAGDVVRHRRPLPHGCRV